MSEYIIGFCVALMVVTTWPQELTNMFDDHYVISRTEYNELTQEGKVWAYVRKDVKP